MLSYGEYLRATSRDDALAYSEAREKSSDLAGAIRRVIQDMRMHRDSSGAGGDGDSSISGRLMHCLRAYNGMYSPAQMQEIKKFGGSEGFARITAVKCRSLTALLEDLYLGTDRPWKVEPTPVPTLPEDIAESIQRLVMAEVQGAVGPDGEPPDASMILDRMGQLHEAALRAAKDRAMRQSEQATLKLDDMLIEGGFYSALKEFLSNFSRFPFAVLKGPYFKMQRAVAYVDKMPAVVEKPIQAFSAPNPFDIWFSPSASKASDGDIIERLVLNRFDLEALRASPSYDADAIDAVLSQMASGHSEWTSAIEQTRADQENRESPMLRDTKGLYDTFEFHGWVEGETAANDPILGMFDLDPDRSHHCTVRMINNIVISAHPNPDPMERVIYHVDSFERVPGSVIGRGLPEVLMDVQGLANAAFRAVINNMGLSCLPADTVVYRHGQARNGAGEAITIGELLAKKDAHNSGLRRIKLRSVDEQTGKLTGNRIVDIHENGVQPVFRVRTSKGYTIRATANHRFLSDDGVWRELDQFFIGDNIAVNGTATKPRPVCCDCTAPLSDRKGALRCKSCAAKNSVWNRKQALEALSNQTASETTVRGRSLALAQKKHVCETCGTTDREDLVLLGLAKNVVPRPLHLHHKDKDPFNAAPDNLMTLCEPCHKEWHVRHGHFGDARKHRFMDFDRITAIEYAGTEPTYDLEMTAPNHNFVADGFIVHNSGPQVGINSSSFNEGENGAEMYPWKRWTFTPDPAAPTAPPLIFFQPSDNSQNLMNVFDRAMVYADEVSAIPRFSAGGTAGSGAGRTASGLAMLQGNVARVVKQIAGSIDETIIAPILQIIYDMTLLTDTTGVFRGDEKIRPLGIQAAAKQETEKMRALEMLQITANPIDMQILGMDARAMLLKEVADNLGFDQGKLGALLDQRAKTLTQQGTDPTAPPPQQGGTPPGGQPPPGAGQNQQGSMPGPANSTGGVGASTEGMMRTG